MDIKRLSGYTLINNLVMTLVLSATLLVLQSCASSAVSRGAASQVDRTYQSATNTFDNADAVNIADAYQNSSQKTQGMIVGGATGAVAGGLTTAVGIVPGALEGVIFGGAIGAYLDSRATLRDKLANRQVKVIVLGDQVLIVLLSQMLFNDMTPTLKPYAYSTLDLIAELINGYPNMAVKVAAYTNATYSARVSRALCDAQAKAVVKYLWRRGINTRLLFAAGYGGVDLVEKNSQISDGGYNYRIEISLEKLPV
jgi:outer membrane protein OmpA-like peptidoglycan-associated protein